MALPVKYKLDPARIGAAVLWLLVLAACTEPEDNAGQIRSILAAQAMKGVEWALAEEPETITAFPCERGAGGLHDFYSESDYWWPDKTDPAGPYIHIDGYNNPDIYTLHRRAVIRFSRIVGALASGYLLTGDDRYVLHAMKHAEAWFVDPATRMNPDMLYAQSVPGVANGRRTGIVDAVHLVEVARGLYRMSNCPAMDGQRLEQVRKWFAQYVRWLSTHPFGLESMNAGNNHTFCWVLQVATFSELTGEGEKLEFCRQRMKNVLLSQQMAADGSFPAELARNKPYSCSLFTLEVVAAVCQVLSTPEQNLWEHRTADGKGVQDAIRFIAPYIGDKESWPFAPDVTFFDRWPVAQTALLFGALAYGNQQWLDLWKQLPSDIVPGGEVERNFPIRNPLIWLP